MKLVLFAFLLFSGTSYATPRCHEECSGPSDACLQLGIRGRASALHLAEVFNFAFPESALPWKASACHRVVTAQADHVESQGEDCTEWMDPFPGRPAEQGEGSRSIWSRTVSAKRVGQEIFVEAPELVKFDLLHQGQVVVGGNIQALSRHPDGRLIIATDNICFSID